jgi:hypothetical protein
VYEVVLVEGNVVTVAVVEAPGLEAGRRIRFVREAFAGMKRIEED